MQCKIRKLQVSGWPCGLRVSRRSKVAARNGNANGQFGRLPKSAGVRKEPPIRNDARSGRKNPNRKRLGFVVDGASVPGIKRRTESKRCWLLRSIADPSANLPLACGQSSRFFARIGRRKWPSTSSAFRDQVNSQIRNRTRVRSVVQEDGSVSSSPSSRIGELLNRQGAALFDQGNDSLNHCMIGKAVCWAGLELARGEWQ